MITFFSLFLTFFLVYCQCMIHSTTLHEKLIVCNNITTLDPFSCSCIYECEGNGNVCSPRDGDCECEDLKNDNVSFGCSEQYFSLQFEEDMSCFGIDSGSPLVCSKHGDCVAQDTCMCTFLGIPEFFWAGDECTEFFLTFYLRENIKTSITWIFVLIFTAIAILILVVVYYFSNHGYASIETSLSNLKDHIGKFENVQIKLLAIESVYKLLGKSQMDYLQKSSGKLRKVLEKKKTLRALEIALKSIQRIYVVALFQIFEVRMKEPGVGSQRVGGEGEDEELMERIRGWIGIEDEKRRDHKLLEEGTFKDIVKVFEVVKIGGDGNSYPLSQFMGKWEKLKLDVQKATIELKLDLIELHKRKEVFCLKMFDKYLKELPKNSKKPKKGVWLEQLDIVVRKKKLKQKQEKRKEIEKELTELLAEVEEKIQGVLDEATGDNEDFLNPQDDNSMADLRKLMEELKNVGEVSHIKKYADLPPSSGENNRPPGSVRRSPFEMDFSKIEKKSRAQFATLHKQEVERMQNIFEDGIDKIHDAISNNRDSEAIYWSVKLLGEMESLIFICDTPFALLKKLVDVLKCVIEMNENNETLLEYVLELLHCVCQAGFVKQKDNEILLDKELKMELMSIVGDFNDKFENMHAVQYHLVSIQECLLHIEDNSSFWPLVVEALDFTQPLKIIELIQLKFSEIVAWLHLFLPYPMYSVVLYNNLSYYGDNDVLGMIKKNFLANEHLNTFRIELISRMVKDSIATFHGDIGDFLPELEVTVPMKNLDPIVDFRDLLLALQRLEGEGGQPQEPDTNLPEEGTAPDETLQAEEVELVEIHEKEPEEEEEGSGDEATGEEASGDEATGEDGSSSGEEESEEGSDGEDGSGKESEGEDVEEEEEEEEVNEQPEEEEEEEEMHVLHEDQKPAKSLTNYEKGQLLNFFFGWNYMQENSTPLKKLSLVWLGNVPVWAKKEVDENCLRTISLSDQIAMEARVPLKWEVVKATWGKGDDELNEKLSEMEVLSDQYYLYERYLNEVLLDQSFMGLKLNLSGRQYLTFDVAERGTERSYDSIDEIVLRRETNMTRILLTANGGGGKTCLKIHIIQKLFNEKEIFGFFIRGNILSSCYQDWKNGDEEERVEILISAIRDSFEESFSMAFPSRTLQIQFDVQVREIMMRKKRICLCFDGFDEIPSEERPWFNEMLRNISSMREIKVATLILSSRDEAISDDMRERDFPSHVKINMLDSEGIKGLITSIMEHNDVPSGKILGIQTRFKNVLKDRSESPLVAVLLLKKLMGSKESTDSLYEKNHHRLFESLLRGTIEFSKEKYKDIRIPENEYRGINECSTTWIMGVLSVIGAINHNYFLNTHEIPTKDFIVQMLLRHFDDIIANEGWLTEIPNPIEHVVESLVKVTTILTANKDYLMFTHKNIQEFFCARMYTNPDRSSHIAEICRKFQGKQEFSINMTKHVFCQDERNSVLNYFDWVSGVLNVVKFIMNYQTDGEVSSLGIQNNVSGGGVFPDYESRDIFGLKPVEDKLPSANLKLWNRFIEITDQYPSEIRETRMRYVFQKIFEERKYFLHDFFDFHFPGASQQENAYSFIVGSLDSINLFVDDAERSFHKFGGVRRGKFIACDAGGPAGLKFYYLLKDGTKEKIPLSGYDESSGESMATYWDSLDSGFYHPEIDSVVVMAHPELHVFRFESDGSLSSAPVSFPLSFPRKNYFFHCNEFDTTCWDVKTLTVGEDDEATVIIAVFSTLGIELYKLGDATLLQRIAYTDTGSGIVERIAQIPREVWLQQIASSEEKEEEEPSEEFKTLLNECGEAVEKAFPVFGDRKGRNFSAGVARVAVEDGGFSGCVVAGKSLIVFTLEVDEEVEEGVKFNATFEPSAINLATMTDGKFPVICATKVKNPSVKTVNVPVLVEDEVVWKFYVVFMCNELASFFEIDGERNLKPMFSVAHKFDLTEKEGKKLRHRPLSVSLLSERLVEEDKTLKDVIVVGFNDCSVLFNVSDREIVSVKNVGGTMSNMTFVFQSSVNKGEREIKVDSMCNNHRAFSPLGEIDVERMEEKRASNRIHCGFNPGEHFLPVNTDAYYVENGFEIGKVVHALGNLVVCVDEKLLSMSIFEINHDSKSVKRVKHITLEDIFGDGNDDRTGFPRGFYSHTFFLDSVKQFVVLLGKEIVVFSLEDGSVRKVQMANTEFADWYNSDDDHLKVTLHGENELICWQSFEFQGKLVYVLRDPAQEFDSEGELTFLLFDPSANENPTISEIKLELPGKFRVPPKPVVYGSFFVLLIDGCIVSGKVVESSLEVTHHELDVQGHPFYLEEGQNFNVLGRLGNGNLFIQTDTVENEETEEDDTSIFLLSRYIFTQEGFDFASPGAVVKYNTSARNWGIIIQHLNGPFFLGDESFASKARIILNEEKEDSTLEDHLAGDWKNYPFENTSTSWKIMTPIAKASASSTKHYQKWYFEVKVPVLNAHGRTNVITWTDSRFSAVWSMANCNFLNLKETENLTLNHKIDSSVAVKGSRLFVTTINFHTLNACFMMETKHDEMYIGLAPLKYRDLCANIFGYRERDECAVAVEAFEKTMQKLMERNHEQLALLRREIISHQMRANDTQDE